MSRNSTRIMTFIIGGASRRVCSIAGAIVRMLREMTFDDLNELPLPSALITTSWP